MHGLLLAEMMRGAIKQPRSSQVLAIFGKRDVITPLLVCGLDILSLYLYI